MEQLLICMSLSLIAGLLASRAAKAVRLPAVTSYLVAGLLLGPFFLGRLGLSGWGFGFGSLAQVESYGIITQVALGFIAFVIGNEFRLSALEKMGRQAVTVGILQAVITTVLVDIALVALHFARPDVISMASAITLGAIASATAPAATLMVVKQYKASGPLTRLLLMVVAIDDAVGLVLFSASFGIANALEQGRIDPISVLLEPLVEIVLSLGLGALAGLLLNQLEIYFHSRSKRMSLSVAFVLLTVGLSMVSFEVGPIHCSFSLLLVCMMTGTVFCNICPTSDELMDRLDRWVSPVNILFFVLSGAELDLNILTNPMVLLIGAVYIASRSLGKISGSYVSCKATRCSEKIQKYLGITLLPQAGVALGMAATAAELSDGHMVRNVVLFSVLVYELALAAAPEGAVRRLLTGSGVALAMTLCIYVTHLIYAFVLLPTAHRRDDESWLKGRFSFGNVCVHFITPGLTVLQWLLWQDKAGLTVGHAVWWLVLPLAYFAFAMLRAGTGKPIGRTGQLYPYPFLDYPRLGAGRFWLYATAILTFFFGLGCLFVGIGHLLA